MTRSALIPGFRFHPTDVELVMFYLKRKLLGKKITVNAVAEVNIYDFSPWDLPDKSCLKSGDREWFFFCPKAKKYSSGCRSNRSTEAGFWKATGKDRSVKYNDRSVATIKTLVFHIGHKGKGDRTDWVMHEYKMEDEHLANAGIVQDMYVLCKVFKKSGSGPKNGEQYGAPFYEEEWGDDLGGCVDSQVVVGASNTMMDSEPGSSTVTFSANLPTNTLNISQVQSLSGTVPGSLDNEQAGPATMNLTEQVDDFIILEDIIHQLTEPEENEAAPNVEKENEAGANVEKVKSSVVPTTQDDIYTDLVNLIDLDDMNEINFKTHGADYLLDNPLTFDGLEEFYVD